MLFDKDGFIGFIDCSGHNTWLWDGTCHTVTWSTLELINCGYIIVCPD